MEHGALGMSTALILAPCSYANSEELSELNKEVSQFDGVFAIHVRSEGQHLIESIGEAIDICEKSGVALQISHMKAFGKANWHKPPQVLEMIDQAVERGLCVSGDQYPYVAGITLLSACLPQWVLAGGPELCIKRLVEQRNEIKEWFLKGVEVWDNRSISIGWENIIISSVETDRNRWTVGLSIKEIADYRKVDPVDALCDLLVDEELAVIHSSVYGCEENIITYMTYPRTMICTDGIYAKRPHPRLFGTFPRVLGRYVREKKLMTLEEAVHKMTGLPAQTFGLPLRGKLLEGYAADVVIFDPATIIDTATFEEPCQYPVGINYVVINGKIAVENDCCVETNAGCTITR